MQSTQCNRSERQLIENAPFWLTWNITWSNGRLTISLIGSSKLEPVHEDIASVAMIQSVLINFLLLSPLDGETPIHPEPFSAAATVTAAGVAAAATATLYPLSSVGSATAPPRDTRSLKHESEVGGEKRTPSLPSANET